ncbi:MAG: type II toxin-antitoxin system HicA family toxin [Methanosarcinaceae archaeon]|nr:type II toxin-antitoxin system HicA family toxin [Methanosarcinaceae archaeon]
MPKVTPVKWTDFVKQLRNFGFEGLSSGKKHPFMIKGDLVLTIPNPYKDIISVDLLVRILKQAKISREEWLKK